MIGSQDLSLVPEADEQKKMFWECEIRKERWDAVFKYISQSSPNIESES